MNSYYAQWLTSAENWMRTYRKELMRKHTHFIIPAVIVLLTAFFTYSAVSNGDEVIFGILGGILISAVICGVYLLILLPGLSPKRMSRGIQKAVTALALNEGECEQLGREMLESEKDAASVLDYKMVGPKSNNTPARFIISSHYACLWGSYPLVILVRLSDVANISAEEERKTATTYGSASKTIHKFNLHTIIFNYKNSTEEADNGMGFFDSNIRDTVFEMIHKQWKQ